MSQEDLNEKVKELEFKLARIQQELELMAKQELTIPLLDALSESHVQNRTRFQSYVDGSWDGKIIMSKVLLATYFDSEENQQKAESAAATEKVRELKARAEKAEAAVAIMHKALTLISVVDLGCGGNLTFQEMAESAMRQAKAAIDAAQLESFFKL